MVLFLRSKKVFRYIPENESKQPVLGWNKSGGRYKCCDEEIDEDTDTDVYEDIESDTDPYAENGGWTKTNSLFTLLTHVPHGKLNITFIKKMPFYSNTLYSKCPLIIKYFKIKNHIYMM